MKRPFTAGKGGRGRGSPLFPSMENMRAVSSPHTKAPAPILISRSKSKPVSKMFFPRNLYFLRLVDGPGQPFDGKRVFRPDIDVALVGTDRISGDCHRLDHAVRVAFEHAPVHEGARVAFVGVADHDTSSSPCGFVGELPFQARWRSRRRPVPGDPTS